MWSTRMDLKSAFTRLIAEVTQRMALAARHKGALTRGASARFGGSDFQVSVLDGAFAAFVEAEERGGFARPACRRPYRGATRGAPQAVVKGTMAQDC